MLAHPDDVRTYLRRLYGEERRRYACQARDAQAFVPWQTAARSVFLRLLGVPRIAQDAAGHAVSADLFPDVENKDGYSRQRGSIETEPGVRHAFWLLRPKGDGPFPLAITPHGHENGDTYVGIRHDERSDEQIQQEDQDIAVQAVNRGFLTIAPATRGIGANPSSFTVADVAHRHGDQDCRCHSWQVIMAGRTMLGERVWDLMRTLDWACALPDVDAHTVLVTGNSGGGMVTLHAAAADPRITVAVPSCCYNNYVSRIGTLRHCPCNAIPNILSFGEFWDVAGLVAPRHLLTVNGRMDPLHPVEEVEHAAARLKAIYRAADSPHRYEHLFGDGAHRFFGALMWPWIDRAIAELASMPRHPQ